MRIDRISLQNYPPIKMFEIKTSSNVVIIAGANGSGKTRLKDALVNTFRTPQSPRTSISIAATRQSEEKVWEAKRLEVDSRHNCEKLSKYMSTRKGAGTYVGTVIQIDSNRSVQPIRFEQFTLSTRDPDDEDINYSYYLNSFIGRWQQLVNMIYKKSANRDQKIAKFIKENPSKLGSDALREFPDPFVPYQDMFEKLLPGKKLEPIDPKSPREFHYREAGSEPMVFATLSSGEQEVVKVAFDLVWKQITHSIIFLDEPELHLHPTLTFRLVETLKEFGGGTNQLFLFTHSADLISTYHSTGNVFFIDMAGHAENQARQLSALNSTHATVARAASANLGMFAVGKRIVFVEGQDASVDRLIYHKVAQSTFPDSYVMPIGSVDNINALRTVVDELAKTIFGIELFLVRDRDGLFDDTIDALQSNPRFRCLPRRHIENYLLDAEILGEVAKAFYLSQEKQDVSRISSALLDIAPSCITQGVLWSVREHVRVLGALPQPRVTELEKIPHDQLAKLISDQLTVGLDEVT